MLVVPTRWVDPVLGDRDDSVNQVRKFMETEYLREETQDHLLQHSAEQSLQIRLSVVNH